jgi:sugar/nucleoside kinase (ribokinase family)
VTRGLAPEFVAIGHVTLDRFGETARPGGAALYAAVTAHRLGLSAAILTSHGDDFPLDLVPPQIEVVSLPAPVTTRFDHFTGGTERAMRVRSTAQPIGLDDVPEDWRDADIVMLSPVVDEVDPLVLTAFSPGSIGAAVQGYVRRLDATGLVMPRPWASADLVLNRVQAVFLSMEDVGGDVTDVVEWFQRVPVGLLTEGQHGAWLYVNGERYAVRPHAVHEVDATGAGDVFAAAFMLHYHRQGDPWEAASAAACAAALAVEGEGWATVPDRTDLDAALADYRREE